MTIDSLSRLPIFVQAAETRSFTGAARRLGISAAAVSKAVSHLEQSLGVRLFERTTRSVTLTEDGAAYYERCRQVLYDLEEAETALTENRTTPRGRLRVSLQTALGRLYVVPALAGFAARYPELSVEVNLTDRVVDMLGEGFDAALRLGSPPDDPRVVVHRLASSQGVLCASAEYFARYGEPETPQDLAAHNVYLFSGFSGPPFEIPFEKGAEKLKVPVSGNLTANSAETILELTMAGHGIGAVLDCIARPALLSGALLPVLPDWKKLAGPPVTVIYPKSRHLSAKVRAFVDLVAGLLGAEDLAAPPSSPIVASGIGT